MSPYVTTIREDWHDQRVKNMEHYMGRGVLYVLQFLQGYKHGSISPITQVWIVRTEHILCCRLSWSYNIAQVFIFTYKLYPLIIKHYFPGKLFLTKNHQFCLGFINNHLIACTKTFETTELFLDALFCIWEKYKIISPKQMRNKCFTNTDPSVFL